MPALSRSSRRWRTGRTLPLTVYSTSRDLPSGPTRLKRALLLPAFQKGLPKLGNLWSEARIGEVIQTAADDFVARYAE